ncbi:hypothetical protein [Aliamphritea spongicola]|nr:hypothetical protein [Aliamphritea spongicola]
MGLFMLAGILALPDIKRETFPEVKKYEVQVSVAYPALLQLTLSWASVNRWKMLWTASASWKKSAARPVIPTPS